MKELTADVLREVLAYNSEIGIFTWLVNRSAVKSGSVAGCLDKTVGYVRISLFGKSYFAHRLVWLHVHGKWPENYIDHLNGKRSDNRIANLRDATTSTNLQNQRRPSSKNRSGFLGVYWERRSKKYIACLNLPGKRIRLGGFASAEEAYASYLNAKRKLHEGCTI